MPRGRSRPFPHYGNSARGRRAVVSVISSEPSIQGHLSDVGPSTGNSAALEASPDIDQAPGGSRPSTLNWQGSGSAEDPMTII